MVPGQGDGTTMPRREAAWDLGGRRHHGAQERRGIHHRAGAGTAGAIPPSARPFVNEEHFRGSRWGRAWWVEGGLSFPEGPWQWATQQYRTGLSWVERKDRPG